MKRGYFFLIVAIFFGVFFFFGSRVFAATGFVDSPLWLTPSAPNDGDTVELSAVFRNEETSTISGTISFYDNSTLIAQKPVTILSDDVGFVSTQFTISAGDHLFSATMSNAATLTGSGQLSVVVVPTATVSLPEQFVPQTVTVAAQAGGDSTTTDSEGLMLNQINQAETAALSVVPTSAQTAVSNTAGTLDSWRSSEAASFAESRDAAQAAIDTKVAAPAQSAGSVLAKKTGAKPIIALKSDAGPFAYVKLVLFTALAWLFSSAIIFYFLLAFLIFIILRFLFRRIVKLFRKDKGRAVARSRKA